MGEIMYTILLGIVLCATIVSPSVADKNAVEQMLVCEGETANLQCPEGKVINITNANYGRINVHPCNKQGLDYKGIFCMDTETERVMRQRCEKRRECRIAVNSVVFRDNCKKVPKYLQYQYSCAPSMTTTTTTSRPTTTGSGRSKDGSAATPTPPGSSDTLGSSSKSPGDRRGDGQTDLDFVSFCPATSRRDIRWPKTEVGKTVSQPCPNHSYRYAQWYCGANGEWGRGNALTPDLSACKSSNIPVSDNRWTIKWINSRRDIEHKMAALLDMVVQLKQRAKHRLYGGDLRAIVNTLKMTGEQSLELLTSPYMTPQYQQSFLYRISESAIEACNSLLQGRNDAGWTDLPAAVRRDSVDTEAGARGRTAADLLSVVDRFVRLVVPAAVTAGMTPSKTTTTTAHIITEVATMNSDDIEAAPDGSLQLPAISIYNTDVDFVQVPRHALRLNQNSQGVTTVTYASLDKIGAHLPSSNEKRHSTDGSKRDDGGSFVARRVVSKVLMAGIAGVDDRIRGQLTLTFVARLADEPQLSNAQCVRWDAGHSFWLPTGCRLTSHNTTHTVCVCDRLRPAYYAVLMDVAPGPPWNTPRRLYSTVVIVALLGCAIGVLCFAVSLLALVCVSGSGSDERLTIHRHLCISLLAVELLFLFGITQTENRLRCSLIAGALHFWLLAAFSWLLLESFHLYKMLAEAYPNKHSRRFVYYLFGYGVPALIVGGAVWYDGGDSNYSTDAYCWLRSDKLFSLVFSAPAALLVVTNVVLLAVTAVTAYRQPQRGSGHSYDACRRAQSNGCSECSSVDGDGHGTGRATRSLRLWLKEATTVLLLVSLTWLLGLLWLTKGSVGVACAFAVLNCLQGTFFFVFHVAFNEKIQQNWIDCLPSCLRSYEKKGRSNRTADGRHDLPPNYATKRTTHPIDPMMSSPPMSPGLPFDVNNQLLGRFRPLATGREEMDNHYNASMQRLLAKNPSVNYSNGKYDYSYATIDGDAVEYDPTHRCQQQQQLFTFNPHSSQPLSTQMCCTDAHPAEDAAAHGGTSTPHGSYFELPFGRRVPRMPPPTVPPPAPPPYAAAADQSPARSKRGTTTDASGHIHLSDDSAYSEESLLSGGGGRPKTTLRVDDRAKTATIYGDRRHV